MAADCACLPKLEVSNQDKMRYSRTYQGGGARTAATAMITVRTAAVVAPGALPSSSSSSSSSLEGLDRCSHTTNTHHRQDGLLLYLRFSMRYATKGHAQIHTCCLSSHHQRRRRVLWRRKRLLEGLAWRIVHSEVLGSKQKRGPRLFCHSFWGRHHCLGARHRTAAVVHRVLCVVCVDRSLPREREIARRQRCLSAPRTSRASCG